MSQKIVRLAFPPLHESLEFSALDLILRDKQLYSVFQPIINLANSSVHAHEALIRGPEGTALHTPDALLSAAASQNSTHEFENSCIEAALLTWGGLQPNGRLFVNISADVLVLLFERYGREGLLHWVNSQGVSPRRLVLEITEHERIADMEKLAEVVAQIRGVGLSIALDDFGDGRSSLRLWSQIKPEIVKIDKYFTKDISRHGDKLKTIQALQQIAELFGTALVAEGIETAEDLHVIRDMGIEFGQGYFLGLPHRTPINILGQQSERILSERQAAIFPEFCRVPDGGRLRNLSLVNGPTVTAANTVDEVAEIFTANEVLQAVAVLDGDRPVAIINRSQFLNEYCKLYYKELWGRKSCVIHANFEPRLIERDHNVEELIGILTSQDQRYLSDGFIVIENGRFVGLGTGDQLVRSVTETRIEAARHANPLTFLPGNIPISLHIDRLLKKRAPFVACYADLNHFKPFNDHYGYWRGDEMIRLLARTAMAHCDPQCDFLGHVGGDDFILLFQSENWRARCDALVREFAVRALALFEKEAQDKGGIEAEDRYGVTRFFPCTTVSIGAAPVNGGDYSRAEDVANQAAMAKSTAKRMGVGLFELQLR